MRIFNKQLNEEVAQDVYLSFMIDTDILYGVTAQVFELFGYKQFGTLEKYDFTADDMVELEAAEYIDYVPEPADVLVWAQSQPSKQQVMKVIKKQGIQVIGDD